MPRIVLSSAGPDADVRPLAVLGRALRSRGHEVVERFPPFEPALAATPARFARLAGDCRGADLLVADSHDDAAALVHRSEDVPFLCVVLHPADVAQVAPVERVPAGARPVPPATLAVLAASAHVCVPDFGLYEDLRVIGFIETDEGLGAAVALAERLCAGRGDPWRRS